ncbi:MAG TPA: PspC domain-containing protein [Propionibacteriaceae bacterium]|nr:PspC domain-containing protein [Propionibacteriaceae bacterium]
MTNPYPQPPRRLERSRSNKVLGGVCGGIGNYLNMDPTLVRALWVIVSLFTGVPIVLYIVALFVIPEEERRPPDQLYPPVQPPQQDWAGGFGSAGHFGPGYAEDPAARDAREHFGPRHGGHRPPWRQSHAPERPVDPVWGPAGAPWEQPQTGEPPHPPQGPVPPAPPRGPEDIKAEPTDEELRRKD